MKKICPIISKGCVDIKKDYVFLKVYCQKEKCQLWIPHFDYNDTKTDKGHCGLIKEK